MTLEVSKEELSLLKMLLSREEVTALIEIHHARMSFEYRDYLKTRHKEVSDLLGKVKKLLTEE